MRALEYTRTWKERAAAEKKKRDLAIAKAREVARALKEKYRAGEVILFGSLVWRPGFLWPGTDIDLMVEGIDDERYFEIWADVSLLCRPYHLDLIPLEKASPAMKRRAVQEGWRLE